jgi:NAD dependent epimerase/dehydratase family enzyme
MPLPAGVLKVIFGRMAEETLLVSTRAVPARLEASGYVWRERSLESALRQVLGRSSQPIT